jgi:hypothetical protein
VLTFTRNEPLIYEQLARAGGGEDSGSNGHRSAERSARPG